MRGHKYGDNPRFILEELKKKLPKLDFVWLIAEDADIETPAWMRTYLLQDHSHIAENVIKELKIGQNPKILLYVPTYRDGFARRDEHNSSVFGINYEQTKKAVQE